jgi:hypothetical protein
MSLPAFQYGRAMGYTTIKIEFENIREYSMNNQRGNKLQREKKGNGKVVGPRKGEAIGRKGCP